MENFVSENVSNCEINVWRFLIDPFGALRDCEIGGKLTNCTYDCGLWIVDATEVRLQIFMIGLRQ